MITVSLKPFAFRKTVLLVAALIWLTSAMLFADPVFMNAHANQFASRSHRGEALAPAALKMSQPTSSESSLAVAREAKQTQVAAPAEAPSLSLSLDRFDTWKAASVDDELTLWSICCPQ